MSVDTLFVDTRQEIAGRISYTWSDTLSMFIFVYMCFILHNRVSSFTNTITFIEKLWSWYDETLKIYTNASPSVIYFLTQLQVHTKLCLIFKITKNNNSR